MTPKQLRSQLTAAAGLLAIAAASPLAAAEALGFDVLNVSTVRLASATEAGPAGGPRFSHWNSFYGAPLAAAADSNGLVLPVNVSIVPGTNGGYLGTGTISATTGDVSMHQTFLDIQGANTTLTVSNIPYTSYDVYVYVYGDQGTSNDRGGTITVNGSATYAIRTGAGARVTANDGSGYVLSSDTVIPPSTTTQLGNHVRFAGLGGATCTLSFAAYNTLGNGTPRLKLAGFQIVNTGAPLTAGAAPDAATFDTLYPGDGQVIVTWNGALGAASYTVRRAESESGPWTDLGVVGTSGVLRYTDTGLTNGETYFYEIVATNALGATASAPGSVTPYDPATLKAVGVSLKGNTGGGTLMESLSLAGAPGVRMANWNNYELNGSTTLASLVDNNGAAVSGLTATVALAANSRILNDGATSAANDPRLFAHYVDQTANNRTETFSMANVPYARYDVYVYMRDDGDARAGSFTLGSTTYYMRGTGLGNPDSDGTGYRRSMDTTLGAGTDIDQGNYVRFEGITTGSFTLAVTPVNAGNGSYRTKIAGFQIVDTTPAGAPPPTPTGLAVVSGNAQVSLIWNTTPNATGYTISRGTSHAGPFAELATQTGTGYTDTTAANGTTYYYIVTAGNASGPGVATEPVSARPQSYVSTGLSLNVKGAAPAGMVPSDLAGAPSVRLPNWNNLAIPGSTGASTTLASLVASDGAAVTGVTLTYTNGTSVGNGTTGAFGANDRNLFYTYADLYGDTEAQPGNSPATLSVTGIPYASYDLYVYMRNDGEDRAGAVTVNGQTYYVRGGLPDPVATGAGYVHALDTDPAEIKQGNYIRIAGLTGDLNASLMAQDAGNDYARFKLAGIQIISTSPAVAPSAPPAAPGGVSITPGVGQNIVTWSPVEGATGYTISRSTVAGGPYDVLATVSAFVTSYTDANLAEGTTYYYLVTAGNSLGLGAASAEQAGTTLPAAPQALTALGGDGSVTLSWTPAGTASGHVIQRSDAIDGFYTIVATSGAAGSYTDTGLTNGAGYYYRVRTISPVGESADSGVALGVPVRPDVLRTIGVSLSNGLANGPLATDRAGAPGLHRANWNNFAPADLGVASYTDNPASLLGPVAGALVDNTGTVVNGMLIEYIGNTGRTSGSGLGTRNTNHPDRLYASQWDQFNTQTTALTITGIPYDTFDLVVYLADDGVARGGLVEDTMTGLIYYVRGGAGEPTGNGAGYVQANDLSLGAGTDVVQGNYIRIPGCLRYDPAGIKGYAINLRAAFMGDNAQRLKVVGFQFVNTSAATALPAAATDLVALAGDSTVTLGWSPAAGVSAYHIGRATSPGGPYTIIARDVAGVSYTDATAVNGTTYHYVIVSVGDTAGTESAEVAATPLSANPLLAWRVEHFGTAENAGEAADTADPDGDGRPNLLEYATGSHPKQADAGPAIATGRSGAFLTLTYQRIGDPALIYAVEGSDDLASWQTVETENNPSTGAANVEGPVTVTDTVSTDTQPRRFLRLRVSY